MIRKKDSVISERKKRERLSRENSILKAAKKLFFARGYAGTTMDEIALEAEISKPTVYQYFKNKEELYFSLARPLLEKFITEMERMTLKLERGEYTKGREIIEEHFNTYLQHYLQDPETFRVFMCFQQSGLVFEVSREVGECISSLARKRYQGMRDIYSRAIERGLIKKCNVYHLVDSIWGSFQGILLSLDAKDRDGEVHKDFIPTLKFSRDIIADAISL